MRGAANGMLSAQSYGEGLIQQLKIALSARFFDPIGPKLGRILGLGSAANRWPERAVEHACWSRPGAVCKSLLSFVRASKLSPWRRIQLGLPLGLGSSVTGGGLNFSLLVAQRAPGW